MVEVGGFNCDRFRIVENKIQRFFGETYFIGIGREECKVAQFAALLPSSKKIMGSNPGLGSLCMEFACSLCSGVTFLQLHYVKTYLLGQLNSVRYEV